MGSSHPDVWFDGHSRPEQTLGILPLFENDLHGDSLDDLDVISRGILASRSAFRTRVRCQASRPGCHELRIVDAKVNWRIMYHIAADAVAILDVFKKQTEATPQSSDRGLRATP
jgi:phage-related protein